MAAFPSVHAIVYTLGAILSLEFSAIHAINWNGNWAMNCDFPGNDFRNERVRGEDCGGRCAAIPQCTHFAWTQHDGGTCWMKTGAISKDRAQGSDKPGAVCGVVRESGGGGGGGGSGGVAPPSGQGWQVLKRFNMGDMNAIRADWEIERHQPGWVNNEYQEYIDSGEAIFTRNGRLVIRAFRRNGRYYAGRLHSKMTFTPADHAGKKLKVEFKAKVPTKSGGWPALWMLGVDGVYGGWPRLGEIDVMEWVHQVGDKSLGSLHWKGGNDLSSEFQISRNEMENNFNTYGVEYSNHVNDEYVQFYIIKQNGGTLWGPKLNRNTWIWNDFPPCNYKYTAEASRCSFLAPFDNRMMLILNFAVGGDWGNCCGVQSSHYNVFDSGVEMEISDVVVYRAANH